MTARLLLLGDALLCLFVVLVVGLLELQALILFADAIHRRRRRPTPSVYPSTPKEPRND